MDCTHRWSVATPVDGIARGVCTRCGEQRTFSHTAHAGVWQSIDDQARRRRATAASVRSRSKRAPSPGEEPPAAPDAHP